MFISHFGKTAHLILLPPCRDKITSVIWKNPACFLLLTLKILQYVQLNRSDSTSVGLTQNDCRLIMSSQLSVFKDTMRFWFNVMYKNTNKQMHHTDHSSFSLWFKNLLNYHTCKHHAPHYIMWFSFLSNVLLTNLNATVSCSQGSRPALWFILSDPDLLLVDKSVPNLHANA